MNRSCTKIISLFILSSLIYCISVSAQQFPKPQGLINDYAGLLSPSTVKSLNLLSQDIKQKTGFEMVVVTINNTGDAVIEDYANRLYEAWGIGKKGKDEGALLLVFPDKRKVRIEAGYGAEGYLPDAVCKTIIENTIVPYFKAGQGEKAVLSGYLTVAEVVAKNFNTTFSVPKTTRRQYQRHPTQTRKPSLIGTIFLFIIILFLMSTPFGRAILFGMLLGSMLGGRRSSGGGSFGGGLGGGGFSGFGGGMSGGGGASGSW